MPRASSGIRVAVLLFVWKAVLGCSGPASEPTPIANNTRNDTTVDQLRARDDDFATELRETLQDLDDRLVQAPVEEGMISILDDLNQQVEEAAARLDSVGRGLIDHFFRRLIEVLVGMGIFVLVVVLLIVLMVRRSNRRDD